MKTMLAAMFAALITLSGAPSFAGAVLTVINSSGGGDSAEFSRDDLRGLEQISYRTSTEFTDGEPEFSGPLARDVLASVGIGDATIAVMTAANDYAIEVPISDLMTYDVILATSVDGRRLSLRDKGPIWVMYPLDQHEELQDPVYNGRLIWQMVKIELK
ncbi:MAG: molybdopterin-dependent oxidoreductase [Pseudomonadota bacterium]